MEHIFYLPNLILSFFQLLYAFWYTHFNFLELFEVWSQFGWVTMAQLGYNACVTPQWTSDQWLTSDRWPWDLTLGMSPNSLLATAYIFLTSSNSAASPRLWDWKCKLVYWPPAEHVWMKQHIKGINQKKKERINQSTKAKKKC